ncbi:GrxA family glutaredoxin [Vreelandella sulfidaeris]|uniref:Glutaredoxin, GrxA family protein n=1 Tax=Vreelandella sulfidaeris TaxID=115553 RepID=A0A455U6G7_9GAMM|nr:glutaredoxin, GrxA family protein [Halomonas sulfidaeris]
MFITIYGRANCPFCDKAKALANSLPSVECCYIDIVEKGITKADLQKAIGKPVETVPQVFIDGIHIGGFSEFEAHLSAQP